LPNRQQPINEDQNSSFNRVQSTMLISMQHNYRVSNSLKNLQTDPSRHVASAEWMRHKKQSRLY